MKSSQLGLGVKTEMEHKGTYKYIKKTFKKTGKIPSFRQLARHIALDHLKENKKYYSKLRKAKL